MKGKTSSKASAKPVKQVRKKPTEEHKGPNKNIPVGTGYNSKNSRAATRNRGVVINDGKQDMHVDLRYPSKPLQHQVGEAQQGQPSNSKEGEGFMQPFMDAWLNPDPGDPSSTAG